MKGLSHFFFVKTEVEGEEGWKEYCMTIHMPYVKKKDYGQSNRTTITKVMQYVSTDIYSGQRSVGELEANSQSASSHRSTRSGPGLIFFLQTERSTPFIMRQRRPPPVHEAMH